jgi:hypothetical protein
MAGSGRSSALIEEGTAIGGDEARNWGSWGSVSGFVTGTVVKRAEGIGCGSRIAAIFAGSCIGGVVGASNSGPAFVICMMFGN